MATQEKSERRWIVGENGERVAVMNNDAVSEAKVYTGRIHYGPSASDGGVDLPQTCVVEVGNWTAKEDESEPEDYLSTYHAARLLGFGKMIDWLPAGEERNGERKYIIFPGYDDDDVLLSFTPEEASRIANAINEMMNKAQALHEQLHPKQD